jgi:hypothetical protein
MSFDLADTVPLTVEIRDAAGVLVNASSVVCTITLPDTTTTTPTVSNPSTGRYTVDYVTVQPGRHAVRWVSTGPASAFTDQFDVRPAAPGYIISLADAKAKLRISATNTAQDEQVRTYVEAATLICERVRGEAIVRRTVSEPRMLRSYSYELPLWTTPVISLTSIATIDQIFTWDVTSFDVDGPSGLLRVKLPGGLPLWGQLTVNYVAGYTVIPANYTMAAKLIVQHLYESERGEKGAARLGGGEPYEVPGMGTIPRLAYELLGPGIPGLA